MGIIVRRGHFEPNRWKLLETPPDAPLGAAMLAAAEGECIVVRFARLLPDALSRLQVAGNPGLRLGPTDDPALLAPYLGTLALIEIELPRFDDGRSYSIARRLRELGYHGELRAVGDVLRDQIHYLMRCGFDAFALRADQDPMAALAAFCDFSDAYQAAADRPLPLFRRRAAA